MNPLITQAWPDIVKSHNQRAEWEMNPAIDETAGGPFAEPDKKLGPGSFARCARCRIEKSRYRELLNCDFHGFLLTRPWPKRDQENRLDTGGLPNRIEIGETLVNSGQRGFVSGQDPDCDGMRWFLRESRLALRPRLQRSRGRFLLPNDIFVVSAIDQGVNLTVGAAAE